jgi:hypothetical protein
MALEDYEPVQSRFARFIEWCTTNSKNPRVLSEMLSAVGSDICVFRTSIYIDDVLVATGHAEEIRDTSGKRSVNATSHVENCETSSLGRSLSNFPFANFAGTDFSKRPSREEMEKVQRGTVHNIRDWELELMGLQAAKDLDGLRALRKDAVRSLQPKEFIAKIDDAGKQITDTP